jgi:hypothetical protein
MTPERETRKRRAAPSEGAGVTGFIQPKLEQGRASLPSRSACGTPWPCSSPRSTKARWRLPRKLGRSGASVTRAIALLEAWSGERLLLQGFQPPPIPVHLVFLPTGRRGGAVRAFGDHAAPLLRQRLAEINATLDRASPPT